MRGIERVGQDFAMLCAAVNLRRLARLDVPIRGIPTALAFLSLFLQQPVPADMASTGTLVADAHDVLTVKPVGDIEHKVDAAYHRNLRLIVVPRGNQAQLEQSALVPRAVTRELVRYVADFDEVARLAFGELGP